MTVKELIGLLEKVDRDYKVILMEYDPDIEVDLITIEIQHDQGIVYVTG